MKITMDGEYAFEGNPTEKVRVLCVDLDGKLPVVVAFPSGNITKRELNGNRLNFPSLIPLQRKPREFWINNYDLEGVATVYHTEAPARKAVGPVGETIHVREVLE